MLALFIYRRNGKTPIADQSRQRVLRRNSNMRREKYDKAVGLKYARDQSKLFSQRPGHRRPSAHQKKQRHLGGSNLIRAKEIQEEKRPNRKTRCHRWLAPFSLATRIFCNYIVGNWIGPVHRHIFVNNSVRI